MSCVLKECDYGKADFIEAAIHFGCPSASSDFKASLRLHWEQTGNPKLLLENVVLAGLLSRDIKRPRRLTDRAVGKLANELRTKLMLAHPSNTGGHA